MAELTLSDFNQGGLSDSKVSGIPNSLYRCLGFDLHTEPGIVKVNPKITTLSTINELCKAKVSCSNGKSYWFSSESGKVWQIDGITVSQVYTIVATSGGNATLGAREYQGFIYFFTQNWIHRIPVTGLNDWATNTVANWNQFLNGDADFHPSVELNLVLYIGDGNVVAQVDHEDPSDIYSNNALDLAEPNRVSALGKFGTDLLIGTYINETVNYSAVYRWNTWGESFGNEAPITENGINAFIQNENSTIVSAGKSGSLYFYNGSLLSFMRKIPGIYGVDAEAVVNPEAVGIFRGNLSIFGVSNINGTPCDAGVYSFGRYSPSYKDILTTEFLVDEVDDDGYNVTKGLITIGALLVSGVNLYVSWEYTDTNNITTSKVGYLDYSTPIAKAILETRTIIANRTLKTTFTNAGVAYVDLPEGTSFNIKHVENFGADYSDWSGEVRADPDNKIAKSYNAISANVLQVRIEAIADGSSAPSFHQIIVGT